jgi:hypothetical protein
MSLRFVLSKVECLAQSDIEETPCSRPLSATRGSRFDFAAEVRSRLAQSWPEWRMAAAVLLAVAIGGTWAATPGGESRSDDGASGRLNIEKLPQYESGWLRRAQRRRLSS